MNALLLTLSLALNNATGVTDVKLHTETILHKKPKTGLYTKIALVAGISSFIGAGLASLFTTSMRTQIDIIQ